MTGNVGAARLDETHMIAAVRSRLAAHRTPRRFFVVSELPRNAMGKLLEASFREKQFGTFRR
jgi:malonyl-CoA/methylmalonyl-CoA synthetase